MKVRFTARELAAKIDVSYAVASGMLSFFEDMGVAVVADKLTHWTGRGKKTRVYELDDMTTIDFGKVAAVEIAAAAVDTDTVETVESVTEPVETVESVTEPVETVESVTEPVETEAVEAVEAVEVETTEDEVVETLTVVEDEDEDEVPAAPDYVAEARARLAEAV